MKIYTDWNDWWIGLYRGPHHRYASPAWSSAGGDLPGGRNIRDRVNW
jgi:hypothetical protein